MKKIILSCLSLFFLTTLFGEGETKINSTIQQVTVFRKGAQITRKAQAKVSTGTSVLKFINIAPNIEKASIQVKADGNFTVLSVTHQLNYFEAPEKSTAIDQLFNDKEKLQDQINEENTMLSVYKEEEAMILANKTIGGQQNGVQISELRATAEFYRSRLAEIKLKKLAINKKVISLKKDLAKTEAQLQELNGKLGTYTSEILVSVNADVATAGTFLLTYVVKNAGWFPNYDIRVKDIQSPANLNYKANVYQTSGEDWKDVSLTLSTGNPTQSGTKPELAPWLLRFYVPSYGNNRRQEAGVYYGLSSGPIKTIQGRVTDQYGEGLIGATVIVSGTTTGTVTDLDGNYTIEVPAGGKSLTFSYVGFETFETAISSGVMNVVMNEGMILDEVVVVGSRSPLSKVFKNKKSKQLKAEKNKLPASKPIPVQKEEKTTSVEFKIDIPYTIPTDGQQKTVQIKKEEIPAFYQYYCVPKIDEDAFLTAQITDWENYDLLSGEVNLFFEGTYLGKSFLDVGNLEDTLNISLGRDKNIIIERKRLKEFTKKQFIGNKRTDSRAWEIDIRNKKKQPINLVIEDQFPISTTDEIEVTQGKYQGATLDEDTGKLVWKIKMAPTESKTLTFNYSVKYPKKKRLQLE